MVNVVKAVVRLRLSKSAPSSARNLHIMQPEIVPEECDKPSGAVQSEQINTGPGVQTRSRSDPAIEIGTSSNGSNAGRDIKHLTECDLHAHRSS